MERQGSAQRSASGRVADLVLNSDCCSVQAGSFASLAPTWAARLLSLQVYDSMVKPAFIFDGRNILDHAKLRCVLPAGAVVCAANSDAPPPLPAAGVCPIRLALHDHD